MFIFCEIRNTVYSNDYGDKLYRLENGNIFYNNSEYEIGYGFLFEHRTLDRLSLINSTRSWPPEAYWIEIYGDEIFIFELTENPPGIDDWIQVGEYLLVNTLRKVK